MAVSDPVNLSGLVDDAKCFAFARQRRGLVAKAPAVELQGEVEIDAVHVVAGHKALVGYSGKRVPITDPVTGRVRLAETFVAVLGASGLIYAEATWTQTPPGWIGAHVRLLRLFARRRACWCRTTSRAASTRPRCTIPR